MFLTEPGQASLSMDIRGGENCLARQSLASLLSALYRNHLQPGCSFPALQTMSFRTFIVWVAGAKRTHTHSFRVLLGVSLPLKGRQQGKVTEEVGKIIHTFLRVDALVERDQVHKLP